VVSYKVVINFSTLVWDAEENKIHEPVAVHREIYNTIPSTMPTTSTFH